MLWTKPREPKNYLRSGPSRARSSPRRRQKPTGTDEIQQRNKKFLLRTFSKELQDKPKQDTKKRTAPVRMHALVAFSGIKTAKDFQTFSRDIAYTGANSMMNPTNQGYTPRG